MTEPGAVPPHVEESIRRSARSISRLFLALGLIIVAYGIWLRHEQQVSNLGTLIIVGVGLILVFTNSLRLTK